MSLFGDVCKSTNPVKLIPLPHVSLQLMSPSFSDANCCETVK